jgi:diketogulonate reductase-like aldo/keto reductase
MRVYCFRKELPEMLENEEVLSISKKHGKTPSQVLLRYIVQRDIVVIPKSTNPERLALNIKVRITDYDVWTDV